MSRIQSLAMALVMALGVALIGAGLLGDGEPSRAAAAGAGGAQAGPGAPGLPSGPRRGAGPPPQITVVVRHAGDGTPAVGAVLRLWRRATGEGPAHRRARRIGPKAIADSEGRAMIVGQTGVSLELVAEAHGAGPTLRTPLEVLRPGESKTIEIRVERPPAPMRFALRSSAGAPLVGASIWGVKDPRPAPSPFPGERSDLLRRTNREGIADLTRTARTYSWILVDAAGFVPFAVSAKTLRRSLRPLEDPDRREQFDVTLTRAGTLVVSVTTADGAGARQAEVRVMFSLDGLPVTTVHWTDRRGEAVVRDVPANLPLAIEVTARSTTDPAFRRVVEVGAGERKTFAVQLGR